MIFFWTKKFIPFKNLNFVKEKKYKKLKKIQYVNIHNFITLDIQIIFLYYILIF